jgi:DNA-binding transcriptional regulator LsrR (DeoR family)
LSNRNFDLTEELNKELQKQGITQAMLAKELGVDQFFVKRFISKLSKNMEVLVRISKILKRDFFADISESKME